jgi:hypothetical protein
MVQSLIPTLWFGSDGARHWVLMTGTGDTGATVLVWHAIVPCRAVLCCALR